MKTDMTKVIFGTILIVCAAVCAGYFVHRKSKSGNIDVKDVLKLKHIFDWVDEILPSISKGSGEKMEINILPNASSQVLTKLKDKRVYVAILQKDINGEKKVLKTKVYYANSVDVDLSSLNNGNIIVIPIE